jgi:hypothetical protein
VPIGKQRHIRKGVAMRSSEGPMFDNTFRVMPFEADAETLRIRRVEKLQQHRDLDETIAMLWEADSCDELLIARLKKRKLGIKDEIARIEQQLPGRTLP